MRLAAILIAVLAGFASGGFSLYRYIVYRKKTKGTPDPAKAPSPARRLYAEGYPAAMAWLESRRPEPLTIHSFDGLRLSARLYRADKPTSRVALCVHGYGMSGEREFLYIARMYLEQLHMNVLLVDDRGHGESGGKHITFGWFDCSDVLDWTGKLSALFGGECEIVLHGISMGAATALMAAGMLDTPTVKWVVSDCAYSSMEEQVRHSMHTMHVPAFPLLHFASLWCRLLAGFRFSQPRPIEYAQKIKVPVLFIHGENDNFVPTPMVQKLYTACTAPKSLLLAPGAAHAESFLTDPSGYEAAIRRLLAINPLASQ